MDLIRVGLRTSVLDGPDKLDGSDELDGLEELEELDGPERGVQTGRNWTD